MDDPIRLLTPGTLVSVALAGVFLGWFTWSLTQRVRLSVMFANWVAGFAFLALLAVGRVVDGSDHPAIWFGVLILWTLYIGVGTLAVLVARRLRSGKVDA